MDQNPDTTGTQDSFKHWLKLLQKQDPQVVPEVLSNTSKTRDKGVLEKQNTRGARDSFKLAQI